MAEQVGSIYFDLDLDDKKYQGKLAGAEAEAKTFSNRVGDYFDASRAASMKLAAGIGILATAMGALGGFGLKTAGDFEAARQGLLTLLGDAEKADKTMARIKKEAAATPFELPGLTQATQLLTSVTKDGDKAIDILLDVGEGLAAMGKGQAELDRIVVNLQQIGAVGKASMIDIKQFAFAGIPIFEMLQQTTGKTGDALSDFIAEGGVTFEMLTDMFDKANDKGGRFFNAFKNQAGGFNQLVSNMKDTFTVFMSDLVVSTGLFDFMKDAMQRVLGFLDSHKETIKNAIVNGLAWIKENGAMIAAVLGGALLPAVLGLVGAFAGFLLTLAPWMALGVALSVLIPKLVDAFGGWEVVTGKLSGVWKTMLDVGEKVVSFVKDLGQAFKIMFEAFMTPGVQEAKNAPGWMQAFATAGEVLRPIVDGLIFVFNGLWSIMSSIVAFVVASFIPSVLQIISYMQQFGVIQAIIDLVTGAVGLLIVAWRVLQPAVTSLVNVVMTQLLPALMNLWTAIAPVLMPVLRTLIEILTVIGAIVGAVLVAAIWLAINALKVFISILSGLIQVVSFVVGVISGILAGVFEIFTLPFRLAYNFVKDLISGKNFKEIFDGIVQAIKNSLAGVWDAITSPFKKAFDWVSDRAGDVGNSLQKLNPFHRESPSLVDWINRGTKVITDQYGAMFRSLEEMAAASRPQLSGAIGGAVGEGATSVTTNIFGGVQIGNQQDADYWLGQISYSDKLTSKGLSGTV